MAVYTHKTFMRKLENIKRNISQGTDTLVTGAGKYAYTIAKQKAPKDTKTLIRNIEWKRGKDKQAWLIQKNPGKQNPSRYGARKGTPFNYAFAMNSQSGSKGAMTTRGIVPWINYIHSGDPNYMTYAGIETFKELRRNVRVLSGRILKTK
jgi:hypothetical protein